MNTHRPMIVVFSSFALGILCSPHIANVWIGTIGTALVTLGILSFVSSKKFTILFVAVFFLALGIIYVKSFCVVPKDHINHVVRYYRGKTAMLEGVIISDVEERKFFRGKKTIFTIEVKRIMAPWGWQNRSGKILVNLFRSTDFEYGDYVRLEGKLHRPFKFSDGSRFSYQDYLARQGLQYIFSMNKQSGGEILSRGHGFWLKSVSLKLRQQLKEVIGRDLSTHEAAIMQAMLLGGTTQIDRSVNDLFLKTGTAHILAISGFNIGIVAFVIFLFLKILPIGRRPQIILTILLLIFYAFLTGGRPPVVRATIMTVIFLAGFLVERESDSFNTLFWAAFLILLSNPLSLFDVGFQLSFVSVWFIIYCYPRWMKSWAKLPWPGLRWVVQSLIVSVAAWMGVAALIAYYFEIVTPITILANLFVIPLSTAIIALGLGLMLIGGMIPAFSFMFVYCIKFILNMMVILIYWLAQVPLAYFYLKGVSHWYVIIYYVVILFIMHWKFKHKNPAYTDFDHNPLDLGLTK